MGYVLDGYANPNGKRTRSKNPLKRFMRRVKRRIKSLFQSDDLVRKIYPEDSDNDVFESVTSSTETLDPTFRLREWENIRVGDFILLRESDQIPADILILSTSEIECVCFIETKNLDGETNLKVKRGVTELNHIKEPKDCFHIKGYVDAEGPNPNLYTFQGRLVLDQGGSEVEVPVGPNGVLLRGCILRNTSWVIGLVIYTGLESKIMLNSGPTPSKRSKVDKQVNPQILVNCLILLGLCVICAAMSALYSGTFVFSSPVYLGTSQNDIENPVNQSIFTFFMSLILFQNIIPIALYISMEISNSVQAYLIHVDTNMYDEDSGKSVQPKSWNLCDDLGQIEYIFSDKTGTLTSNQMDFRKASINGIVYGSMNNYESDSASFKKKFEGIFEPKYFDQEPSFVDPLLPHHIKENGIQAVKIREFFTLLAVCHTVLVERPEETNNPNTIRYLAQSPDEAALVNAAKNSGFACLDRTDNKVEVDVMGVSRIYTILNIMEFNSDRKRMSIVIKRPEGDILLLCKGADSVIYERLNRAKCAPIMETTSDHLQQFANEGCFSSIRLKNIMFSIQNHFTG
jgi:phospholipid-translocating ATPase